MTERKTKMGMGNWGLVAVFVWGAIANSEPKGGGGIETTAGIAGPRIAKTAYRVDSDSTKITTTIVNDNTNDERLSGYLFQSFRRALQATPFVTSVQQTAGEETTETSSWASYDTLKRKSHAFVNLSASSQLTLLFEIEESYRRCKSTKPGASAVYDGYDGGGASSCTRETSVTVRGPLSVYGTFASAINVDALLRNKQEFEITLGKSYDSKDTVLTSTFKVKSGAFDESLARFFKVFNIPVFGETGVDIGAGGLLDKVTPLTTRQRLLIGISRIARQANERMLSL